jgi:hypothetical protein
MSSLKTHTYDSDEEYDYNDKYDYDDFDINHNLKSNDKKKGKITVYSSKHVRTCLKRYNK